ncbi:ETV7 factor, partial [Atractosteus spatula]|nr:ETV7 factor [Atractosteus spatula]
MCDGSSPPPLKECCVSGSPPACPPALVVPHSPLTPVYPGAQDELCKLPGRLRINPSLWGKDDVSHWLRWAQKEYSLRRTDQSKFEMNGKALCLLTKEDFRLRCPSSGDVLYELLQHVKQQRRAMVCNSLPKPLGGQTAHTPQHREFTVRGGIKSNITLPMSNSLINKSHNSHGANNMSKDDCLSLIGNGVSPPTPPMCSIHLDDATTAIVRQNTHHTSAISGEESRVTKPIHRWGLLGGHECSTVLWFVMAIILLSYLWQCFYKFYIWTRDCHVLNKNTHSASSDTYMQTQTHPAPFEEKVISRSVSNMGSLARFKLKKQSINEQMSIFMRHYLIYSFLKVPCSPSYRTVPMCPTNSLPNNSPVTMVRVSSSSADQYQDRDHPLPVFTFPGQHIHPEFLGCVLRSTLSLKFSFRHLQNTKTALFKVFNNLVAADVGALSIVIEPPPTVLRCKEEPLNLSNRVENPCSYSSSPLTEANGKIADCRLLWDYVYQLLSDSRYEPYIRWEDRETMVFRIVDPNGLARLWGNHKNRANMTYEKMSRALRHYYKLNIIKKEPGQKLLFRFLKTPEEIMQNRADRLEQPDSPEQHSPDYREEGLEVSPDPLISPTSPRDRERKEMPEGGTEGEREAEEGYNEDEAAMMLFAHYSEARAALPWEQRTVKEKFLYYVDHGFLVFLAIFLVVLLGEAAYKMWYVTNWKELYKAVVSVVTFFFTQEEEEELLELMRYVAAYLLAVLGGNNNPTSKDIKNILQSVGIEADDERLSKVISELNGKDVNEVMNAGLSKLASVPAGGAVAAAPAAAAAGGAPGAAPVAEEKKEEKKEESEESDEDMGFGLFD